jgi:hypothetical protein
MIVAAGIMMADGAVIALSAAIFLALILYLTLDSDSRERLTGVTFSIAAVGGIVIYGFSYARSVGGPIAVLRTVIDVGRMFVGVNNVTVFTMAVGEDSPLLLPFWVVHFLAYYSMASAAIQVLGKGAIRKLRTMFLRIRDVVLIYGINESSIAYGRQVAANRHVSVVFVGLEENARESDIRQAGGLLFADDVALLPGKKLLKRLAVRRGHSKLTLCAISDDADANLSYALKLMQGLSEAQIRPEQTSLILLGGEEGDGERLQAYGDRYGYGMVKIFDKAELTARLLMQKYPICQSIRFDENGRAAEDVRVLQIGFGRTGQEVLRKIVAGGQFAGSRFHVHVFDPGFSEIDGFFRLRYASMLEAYDISFEAYGGRSRQVCEYLAKHASDLRYIVVAVGNPKLGREIASGVLEVLAECGSDLPVYQCIGDSVICHRSREEYEHFSLHDADILYGGKMDDVAMEINRYYHGCEGTAGELWLSCDYFSRMSCRASADYLSALFARLKSLGIDPDAPAVRENLAISEHMRWCAFHYVMGYSLMPDGEWQERAEQYRREKAEKGESRVRISKDAAGRKHACLVPWEQLPELSRAESEVTGVQTDYCQMDRDNIRVIAEVLRG